MVLLNVIFLVLGLALPLLAWLYLRNAENDPSLFKRRVRWFLAAVGAGVVLVLAWLYGRPRSLPIVASMRERELRTAADVAAAKAGLAVAKASAASDQAAAQKHLDRADVAAKEAEETRHKRERALAELRRLTDEETADAFNRRRGLGSRSQRAASGA